MRRSADPSARTEKDAPLPVKGGQPIIDVDDAGRVTVDGVAAGDTTKLREENVMRRIDELFSLLKAKREDFKASHPASRSPASSGSASRRRRRRWS